MIPRNLQWKEQAVGRLCDETRWRKGRRVTSLGAWATPDLGRRPYMKREQALKVVLVLVGLLFTAGALPSRDRCQERTGSQHRQRRANDA